jgi:hypothetical protein
MLNAINRMNFDVFVGIDWSGAKSSARTHSISLSWCESGDVPPQLLKGPQNRRDISNWIVENALSGKRMFIGIDCNLGYSTNVITRQFGPHASAFDLWEKVDALNKQDQNFNADLFWKNYKYETYFWSSGKKPDWYNQKSLRRLTEQQCMLLGLGIPECPFKFIGPKQVGKGGLCGMRLAKYLSEHFGKKICIWPFQNVTDSTHIVMSEIYPRLFWNKAGLRNIKVTDMDTLNNALNHFHSLPLKGVGMITDHDCDALITAAGLRDYIQSKYAKNNSLFDIPNHILPIIKSEGWIFGVNTREICG